MYDSTTGASQHDFKDGEKIFSDESILGFDWMSLVDKSKCLYLHGQVPFWKTEIKNSTSNGV